MRFFATVFALVGAALAQSMAPSADPYYPPSAPQVTASTSAPYVNPFTKYLTMTNAEGVITGMPAVVTAQPSLVTYQPPAATYSTSFGPGRTRTPRPRPSMPASSFVFNPSLSVTPSASKSIGELSPTPSGFDQPMETTGAAARLRVAGGLLGAGALAFIAIL